MDDLVGQKLGPYEIRECIGSGGMATVYKAYHPALERLVAIKVLSPELARDTAFLERFKREARVIANLRHPHIVRIYDFQSEGEPIYIVMDYIEGGSLKEQLGKPLDLDILLRIAIEVADALCYAHQQGIIHRDVKPGNILLDREGRAYLSDFGLAKKLEADSQVSKPGMGMGTPDYVAPEQAQGKEVDARSDIYAFGATLYEMATGHVPFDAETAVQTILKHISEPVRPPRELNPELPETLEKVILKAMAKDPEGRFQSVQDIKQALETIMDRRYQQELEALYEQGVGFMAGEEWEKACETFSEISSRDPQFKDVKGKLAEAEKQKQLAELYSRGLQCLAQEDWTNAIRLFMQIIRVDADYREISSKLREATKQQNLEIAYNEALGHLYNRRWDKAIARLREILGEEPDYRNVQDLLNKAQVEQQLAESYEEGQRYYQRKRWSDAISCLEKVVQLDSNLQYQDARSLLETAREEQRLEELYQEGIGYFNQHLWQTARERFRSILKIRPEGYEDVVEKLKEIEKQLELSEWYEQALECEAAGDLSEAIRIYIRILNKDAGYPEVAERLAKAQREKECGERYKRADDYLSKGELEKAIEQLCWIAERQADYLDVKSKLQIARQRYQASILHEEGLKYREGGEWAQAAKIFWQVTQLDPDNGEAAQFLEEAIAKLLEGGKRHLQEGLYEEAMEQFKQVLAVDPDNREAEALLKEVESRLQEPKERSLVPSSPSPPSEYLDLKGLLTRLVLPVIVYIVTTALGGLLIGWKSIPLVLLAVGLLFVLIGFLYWLQPR